MNTKPKSRIKLYGERNTGTRYLGRLLERNLEMELIEGVAPRWAALLNSLTPGSWNALDWYFERTYARNLGWKHSQVSVARLLELGHALDDVHFVVLVKNPYSWLLSMARRPYHRKSPRSSGTTDIESLVSSKWITVGRDNGPDAYRDAVDLWNCKLRSYAELAERFPTTILTYEELVENPEKTVSRIREACGLDRPRKPFSNLHESTKDSDKDASFYRRYYGEELWREKLSEKHIRLVNDRLDRHLLERFGYRLIEPGR